MTCASTKKSAIGICCLVFALFAWDTAFAFTQEETADVTPVESLDLGEDVVPVLEKIQEVPADLGGIDETVVLPEAATAKVAPVEQLELSEGAVQVQQEMSAATPVESLDLSDGSAVPVDGGANAVQVESIESKGGIDTTPKQGAEIGTAEPVQVDGSLEVPPPAALVTDSADSMSVAEKAELSDIVGDTIAKDVAGPIRGQDISLESTNAAIENQKTKLALSGSQASQDEEEGAVVGAARAAKKPFLSAKHIGWLWKIIWIALAIGFLLWLLSLMTAKIKKANAAAANPSSDKTANLSSNKASSLAPNSATAGAAATAGAVDASADVNAGDLGAVFARRPETVDDLTKIGGIDAAAEKRLNQAGVWQYDQLRSMNAQQRANLQRKLNLPRIRWYSLSDLSSAGATAAAATGKAGIDAADAVGPTGNASASLGATGAAADDSGASIPSTKFRDDLTKIGGIDAKVAAELNQEGIYKFEQIESLSPAQKLDYQARFGINFDKLNFGQLASGSESAIRSGTVMNSGSSSAATIGAAAAGAAGIAGFAARAAQTNGSASNPAHQGSGEAAIDDDSSSSSAYSTAAGAVDAAANGRHGGDAVSGDDTEGNAVAPANSAMGYVYTSKPLDADDLSKLDGIDAAAAKRLNEAGIYKFEQLDQLDDQQKAKVAERCQLGDGFKFDPCFPKRGRADASLGFVYTEAPRDADDLTRLAGVDSAAAKRLNEAGIYKFDQLEELSDQQMGELANRFDLPEADPSDWKRCFYAWGRGINTSAEVDQVFENGLLNGIELPQFAEGVFDGDKLSGKGEQVIFRGSNPEGWGTGNTGIEGVETSLNCDSIRSDINYLRIRRTDTQESVVLPMTKGQIFSNGDPAASGWNGSSEVFFGGRHVGAFAAHLPQEAEIKFSQGGWGFGHRYDHNDRQEWGWGGRVIEPTTMEVSVGCVGKTPGTLVFRGTDPSIWNTQSSGENGFAIPIDSVEHPVNFVRIMRQATGEAVIVRVDGKHLLDEGFDPRCGWNGSSEQFSGGVHLGVYHCDLPQDFETRFEFGGWGFGHPYNDNDRQAWGWAGRQLPETTFEISLLQSVPGHMQHEVIS